MRKFEREREKEKKEVKSMNDVINKYIKLTQEGDDEAFFNCFKK